MTHIDDPRTQNANMAFIKASMREQVLSREQEFELARSWREAGDERALHELVRAYTRLVVSTATRFRNYGLPMGDLVQEGNVGLMQAAARFEPEREVRFSTYAAWWIRSAMQDYILRNWSIVRTGTTASQKALFFNLRRLRAKVEAAGAGSLSEEGRQAIATELNVAEADVAAMETRLAAHDQSLNAPLTETSEDSWQDFLSDERDTPETTVMGLHDRDLRNQWLASALNSLNERERAIIRARRLQEEGVTLEELGADMGVSKERVRQLEHRALGKLRQALSAQVEHEGDLLS